MHIFFIVKFLLPWWSR